ncbi:MAG: YajQ family cyclic di-GMP-binding protein [Chloroflexi bacterium]|nr:YajQ family cyclic di-GMP-binding protein [Chloroflexota bacterium]
MAAESSFDVVSQFDRQELANAVDQTAREIGTRYDLKSTGSEVALGKSDLSIGADSEFTLKQIHAVLVEKMVRRGLDARILDWGKIAPAARGTVRQVATLREGLDQELARELVKFIKGAAPKVRPQIQGDAVRVFGRSRDDLQAAIAALRKKEDWPVPLQFINYR